VKHSFADDNGNASLPLVALGALWLIVSMLLFGYWLVDTPSIEVRWQTETEFDTAGFNMVRSTNKDGPFERINDRLIAGASDPAAGSDYLFVDADIVAGETYYYRLEDVELDGDITQHALISTTAPGKPHLLLVFGAVLAMTGITMLYLAWRSAAPRKTHDAELDT
jgi:hypothetical protein